MSPFLLLVLVPAVLGLIFPLLKSQQKLAQWLNVASNVAWLAVFVVAWTSWQKLPQDATFPVVFSWNWLPILKSQFSLGVDGLNMPLIGLNVLLSLCLAFYSVGNKQITSGYLALFSLLNAASVGSLLAADVLAFYVFWEFMLIPLYFLIGRWGGKNRVYAALKFFAFTMTGSLFLLGAILALAYQVQVPSLSWHDIAAASFSFNGWMSLQGLLFLGFLAAFVVKIPMWPFHTWLPDAHTEAPTGGSVILAGVLLKLGVYGIARWCLPLFPEASVAAAPTMVILSCVGILLGAFAALKQTDIKRLIAYSSVSHLGFMVLGLFALGVEGVQGAMFQNIAHGLSTGALFLVFGMIYDRTHSRLIGDYGGLAIKAPVFAVLFVFATMASIGLPGLPGFVGEFLILSGAALTQTNAALVASIGILLGAVYMLTLVRQTIFGPQSKMVTEHNFSLTWNEWTAVMPLILAMLWFGFNPNTILTVAEPSVKAIFSAWGR